MICLLHRPALPIFVFVSFTYCICSSFILLRQSIVFSLLTGSSLVRLYANNLHDPPSSFEVPFERFCQLVVLQQFRKVHMFDVNQEFRYAFMPCEITRVVCLQHRKRNAVANSTRLVCQILCNLFLVFLLVNRTQLVTAWLLK